MVLSALVGSLWAIQSLDIRIHVVIFIDHMKYAHKWNL
jgi:hypothetical protein